MWFLHYLWKSKWINYFHLILTINFNSSILRYWTNCCMWWKAYIYRVIGKHHFDAIPSLLVKISLITQMMNHNSLYILFTTILTSFLILIWVQHKTQVHTWKACLSTRMHEAIKLSHLHGILTYSVCLITCQIKVFVLNLQIVCR